MDMFLEHGVDVIFNSNFIGSSYHPSSSAQFLQEVIHYTVSVVYHRKHKSAFSKYCFSKYMDSRAVRTEFRPRIWYGTRLFQPGMTEKRRVCCTSTLFHPDSDPLFFLCHPGEACPLLEPGAGVQCFFILIELPDRASNADSSRKKKKNHPGFRHRIPVLVRCRFPITIHI